jgi:hypothetical protein
MYERLTPSIYTVGLCSRLTFSRYTRTVLETPQDVPATTLYVVARHQSMGSHLPPLLDLHAHPQSKSQTDETDARGCHHTHGATHTHRTTQFLLRSWRALGHTETALTRTSTPPHAHPVQPYMCVLDGRHDARRKHTKTHGAHLSPSRQDGRTKSHVCSREAHTDGSPHNAEALV